jgi:manganese oxidase
MLRFTPSDLTLCVALATVQVDVGHAQEVVPTSQSVSRLNRAQSNDNRAPAGRLVAGVLTIRLEARETRWYPESDSGPAIPLFAFAEVGRPASIPGPMLRVPLGTQIRASVHNALPVPMRLRGLQERSGAVLDSMVLAPMETRELSFRADVAGTFYYWGRTEAFPANPLPGARRDAMLLGAFIVDSARATPRADERVFVLSVWSDTLAALGVKSERAHGVMRRVNVPRDRWFIPTINGKSWPHTEQFAYVVGDTVRWRMINGSRIPHPMHLHGFYFDVLASGDARRDTVHARAKRRSVVTEALLPGTTSTIVWSPNRPGQWLFHCHIALHMSDATRVGPVAHRANGHANHAESDMGGMVLGIRVKPRTQSVRMPNERSHRRLRLFVTERAKVYGDQPGYSYVLPEGSVAPARDSIRRPASTLVLQRNEPTEIAVLNTTSQMATIHWHGLELESVYDGVGDWSGWGSRMAPPIAPGDSFVVRLTPPRAGTFMYHTHMDEEKKLASGMFGALLVLPDRAVADTTERLLLVGIGGPLDDGLPSFNGSISAPSLSIQRGATHRFRLINISPLEAHTVRLVSGDTVQQWRPIAKDGADLPASQSIMRRAEVALHAGETYDVEIRWERTAPLTLRVVSPETIANRGAFVAKAKPGDVPPRIITDIPLIP